MFRESIEGFRARFASQLVQFGASERVSRVNWCIIWFSSGLQSAFRESIEGFRARFASQLVQFGASECVSRVNWFSSVASERVLRVNWFSSGLQSVFRESIGV